MNALVFSMLRKGMLIPQLGDAVLAFDDTVIRTNTQTSNLSQDEIVYF